VGHGCGGIYNVGSHCQASTNEETADLKDLMPSIVNCRLRELAMTLSLLVVRVCKGPINPITNRNLASSYIKHVTT
jgi:hypothetical protein